MKKLYTYSIPVALVLIVIGLFLYLINEMWTLPATITTLVGLAIIVTVAVLKFDELRAFGARRSTRHGANALILSLVILGILALANFVLSRHSWRQDLTSGALFSLADQTVKVLTALDSDVTVVAFVREMDVKSAEDLFREYAHYTGHFKFEVFDPDKNPDLASEFGLKSYGEVILRFGNSEERIDDMSEEKLTNALIKVTRKEARIIYFLSGHGEKAVDLEVDRRDSYSLIAAELNKVNYVTQKLELFQVENVPEDASVIVLAGPKVPLLPGEINMIEDYLNGGGSALFLLEPKVADTTLEAMLMRLGIGLNNDIVLEQSTSFVLSGGGLKRDMRVSMEPTAATYSQHRITKDFRLASAFPTSRSMSLVEGEGGDYEVMSLIETSKSSWGETDLVKLAESEAGFDDNDNPGPVIIGAVGAARAGKSVGRFVVIGDSDFPSNPYLERAPGNKDLFLNVLSYLADDEDLISIRPKNPEDRRVTMTLKQSKVVFYLLVISFPILILMFGVGIYIKRRR